MKKKSNRGRPKKSEAAKTEEQPKRKRGRPRKNPEPEKAAEEPEIDFDLPPPKKNPVPINFQKHLFQKGQSGNPEGGRLHNKEKKLFQAATEKDFKDLMQVLINGDIDELKKISDEANRETIGTERKYSVMQIMTARVALKIIASGNADAWEKFLTRTYGKPKENIAIDPATLSALKGRVTIQMPSNGREQQ